MAELADAHGSGPCEGYFMGVRIPLSAPIKKNRETCSFLVYIKYYSSSDVQLGHLVASISISLLQNGHTFVVGASSSGALLIEDALLSAFIIINRTKATIMKLIIAIMNAP